MAMSILNNISSLNAQFTLQLRPSPPRHDGTAFMGTRIVRASDAAGLALVKSSAQKSAALIKQLKYPRCCEHDPNH